MTENARSYGGPPPHGSMAEEAAKLVEVAPPVARPSQSSPRPRRARVDVLGGRDGRGQHAGTSADGCPYLPGAPGARRDVSPEVVRAPGRRRSSALGAAIRALAPSTPARRPRMSLTIGVDVGGTKVAGGVVDEDGTILAQHRVRHPGRATPRRPRRRSPRSSRRCGREHEVEAVGIGIAGFVDAARSTVYFAPNLLGWRDGPLREEVEQRVGLPVVVENDANAAAWGEARFGAGREETVHRLRDGRHRCRRRHHRRPAALPRRLRGRRRDRAHPDGRGRPAVRLRPARLLGAVRQRRALVRDARERAARVARARPRSCSGSATAPRRASPGSTSPRPRSRATRSPGRPSTPLGHWLGQGLADLAAVLDPECFVLGGGVSEAGDLVLRADRGGLRAAAHRPRPPADRAGGAGPARQRRRTGRRRRPGALPLTRLLDQQEVLGPAVVVAAVTGLVHSAGQGAEREGEGQERLQLLPTVVEQEAVAV